MRRAMVAGNWKMHGTRASVRELLGGLLLQEVPGDVDVAVFPPSLFIADVLQALSASSIAVGAQNCAAQAEQGALTGEIASSQIADMGCRLVLVGHSERRLILGESDELVAQKFAAIRLSGLTPVLCVGETLEQRQAGETLQVVSRQLAEVIRVSGIEALSASIIAYEPVWAIGTGLTASPEQAQEVHGAIRGQLASQNAGVAQATRILYGGSVKAVNAADLFGMPDIDGGLIGGASLNANEFGAICRAAGK